jgi:hypothetical protein
VALIAKIDPPLVVSDDGRATVHARPYEKSGVSPGAEIFIWTSLNTGGHGLEARGELLGSRIEDFPNKTGDGSHKELVLDVRVTQRNPARPLSLAEISVHRDKGDSTPVGTVGRVLYKHALNKITSIESSVADFVRSHFEGN